VRRNGQSYLLIFVAVLLGVAGELLLKTGVGHAGGFELTGVQSLLQMIPKTLTNPALLVGFICYGLAALVWLVVLSRFDLSFAYPFLALTYVLVPLGARMFLGEEIPTGRWMGIGIIVVGMIVLARFPSK
jgi:multidrug transporter EmrE-like cation transporter